MSLSSIHSLKGFQITTDSYSFIGSALHLPLDLFEILSSPFRATDPDIERLKLLEHRKILSTDEKEWLVNLLNSAKYPYLKQQMVVLFKTFPVDTLESILQNGLTDALKKDGITLERYLDIPFQENPDFKALYQHLLEKSEQAEPTSDFRIFSATWKFISQIIDLLIKISGIDYLIKEQGNVAQFDMVKPMIYGYLLAQVSALYYVMYAWQVATIPAAAATAGAIVLVISIIKIYQTYLRPFDDFYPLINLTTTVPASFINTHLVDETVLSKIAQAIRPGNPVFITGASGVGKTTHMQVFAKQVEKGIYPHLKDKQIFYIDTAQFVNPDEKSVYSNSLLDILKKFQGKEQNVILYFDEAHAAWNQKNQSLAEQFKAISDRFSVVFSTDQYDEIEEKHPASFKALQRRHEKIELQSQTKEQTIYILRKNAEQLFRELPIPEESLEVLIKLSSAANPKRTQPEIALKTMQKMLSWIQTAPNTSEKISKLQIKIANLKVEIEHHTPEAALALLVKLKKKKEKLTVLTAKKEEIAKQHHAYLDLLGDRKKLFDQMDQLNFREWFLLQQFFIPALDKKISALAAELFPDFMDSSVSLSPFSQKLMQKALS